jgi:hypothetical protein
MFKYVLFLTFVVSLASAATISTSATCDGVTSFGTLSASCNDGHYMASANLVISGGLSVGVHVSPSTGFPPGTGSASANFSDDFVFTVNGGIGNGFFFPCFFGSSDAGTSVTMGLAGIGLGINDFLNHSNCMGNQPVAGSPAPKPFTFGVPQIVQVDMTGSGNLPLTREADASESLDNILFFNPSGNLLSNATFTLVEVPEPAAWSLLCVGLMFSLAVAIGGMRIRGRCLLDR